jgi:phage baseplate assembly protein V
MCQRLAQSPALDFARVSGDHGRMDAPVSQSESPYELNRRLENLMRKGTVAEVHLAAPARVRVALGDNTTDWLPWFALRAGGVEGGRHWHPPVVGEQAMVLCPGGDTGQGVALLGLYSDAMPQGSDLPGHERMDWDDLNYWEWLQGQFKLFCMQGIELNVADTCTLRMTTDSVEIHTPGTSITQQGNTVTIVAGGAQLVVGPGQITSNVDIVAKGVSLVKHRHGQVRMGIDESGAPL